MRTPLAVVALSLALEPSARAGDPAFDQGKLH